MKNKFIKFASISFFAITALLNVSCENDDFVPEFTLQPASEEVALTSSLADEYLLSNETKNNIAERFVWNIPNFGVQTEINYSVEGSVSESFDTVDFESGALPLTNYAVKVGDLLNMAQDLLMLDTDPSTLGDDGNPNNTGVIYFRINAYVGSGVGADAISKVSETIALNINLIEKSLNGVPVCEFDQLWAVGSAMPDAGWGWNTPIKFTCSGNGVYSGNVYLVPDDLLSEGVEAFRFFTEEGNWGSGKNYPSFITEGYTIDILFRDAMDGDNNFEFLGDAGNYSLTIDTNNKTITLGEQQVTGVCEFDQLWIVGSAAPDAGWGWATPVQVICNGEGVYSTHVNLIPDNLLSEGVEAFRFFTEEGNWGTGKNYPAFIAEGYTIDALFRDALDGDNNFEFLGEAGNYLLTVDTVAKTITLK